MIQRYDITAEPGNSLAAFLEVDKHENGDWVKWEDVQCLLESIYTDIDSDCNMIDAAENHISIALGEISLLIHEREPYEQNNRVDTT